MQNDAPQHVETSTESTPEGTVESESTPKEAGEEIKPAPKEDTSEGKEAKETDPTQPSSTSEGTSSFRRAGEYRATARRVTRAANQPDGTVNINYKSDEMPDINGFLSDPGENNTVTIPSSATEEEAKALVKEKIQAKAKELAKYGYTVKEEIIFEQDTTVKNFNYVVTFTKETTGFRNDNAPATGTPETQPENNRMPGSDAVGSDGGNQDTDAPKNTESQDGTEENVVSEDAGMQASPSSEKNEHTEVAMNSDEKKPQPEAEDSDGAGQDGMQADEASGRQDAEGGLQGDDPTAHPPQDQTPQNAADNQPKTGVFGEKYFDGTGEITTLVIGGETIDLRKADEPVSSKNHPGLMSDFDKVMVSQGQYQHLIYGAAKLQDGTYTLFVQGKPTENLPEGKAKYQGKVLHFVGKYKDDWFNNSAYKAAGTFTADVDFSQKTLTGKIDTKDFSGMGMQEFTANIAGSGFQGKWKSDNDQGDISGKFYGQDGAEMAGRYDYKNQDNRKDGFGVFAGKKEADAR